jgi:hypothetical protein
MNAAVVNRLKEGSIRKVILFGDSGKNPPPPYVVVKPEPGILKNTRSFRIIVHMEQGYYDELKDYTLIELDNLLLNDYLKDEEGSRFKLSPSGYTDITPEPAGSTYFMERIYYTPITIRN